jgi:DDB1- and CUL4-associated factor 11
LAGVFWTQLLVLTECTLSTLVGLNAVSIHITRDGALPLLNLIMHLVHIVNLFGDTDNQEALPLCPDDRRFCIFSLAFSSDGKKILGGGNDGYIYLYDRECQQRCLKVK